MISQLNEVDEFFLAFFLSQQSVFVGIFNDMKYLNAFSMA